MENSSRIEEESQAQTSEENDHNEEAVLAKAQGLIDKIISSYQDPNPDYLHALASILEAQESRYLEETGHSSSDSVRFSHTIGRLGTLIRDNDEFFELISSEIISDISYRASVQAASTRLLVSCSSTWMYPHVFDDATLDHLKSWAMGNFSSTVCEAELPMEFEMLRTYSTGLLAVALIGASQLVEDVLTSGLSVELMHYLRIRVFGETSSSHKDNKHLSENKNTSCITCTKVREDSRGRSRQLVETAHSGDPLPVDGNSGIERDHNIGNQSHEKGEASWTDGAHDDVNEGIDFCEVDAAEGDGLLSEDLLTRRMRVVEFDRNGADDTGRNRVNRVWGKSKGKGRNNEGSLDTEQPFASPKSRSRLGQARNSEDRSSLRNLETKVLGDVNKSSCRLHTDGNVVERDENDDCFRECKLGSKDISDIVKKAVKAAEAEAQAVNAPAEAVRAAGDAAAECVKSAAVEEFKRTNNEEAAVVAASKYATMVTEAANAIQVLKTSRTASGDALNVDSSTIDAVAVNTDILEVVEPDIKQEVEEFFIPDDDSLAKLREKYSIQCLGVLGEYIEVLRPVLHEKGVDVCIALLVRSSKLKDPSKIAMLVPDVLKLISALAAHRKFAAMFVDRSGVQKLLAIPRVHQTFFGLSSCLFTIGSVQGIMERVCGLPADVVYEIVKLALKLLECPQDPARKNAALFFSAAFVFRAILDCFDALDGQEKLLRLLNDAVCVRLGITSGAIGLSSLGSSQNDRSPSEVLTSSEKQITFHACVALRQYFRAHLLLLVDSIRPTKNNRSASRTIPCLRAAYKPLDLSNEAMDAVILQLQKDRKLGPLFVRAFWPAVVKFLTCKGHIILLELCQAPPDERYLHELLQYALGVLHIVTLVPGSRKQIVNAPLSNDRVGVAVILDAANANASGVNSLETEVVQPALNVLVNLVCPSPSISNKSSPVAEGQHASVQNLSCPVSNSGERIIDNVSEQSVSTQTEGRERNSESKHGDRGTPQIPVPSGLVGERRISLGVGSGCAGLAAQLEQGYSQARDAVRSNNGIKVLLHVLQARVAVPPAALDCIHALACRVLLGLARDDVIAHILTKLQIGKKLSELIRDTSVQTPGTEQARWQAELAQVAIELIGIVTNSGRASTLAATDAATPTLRRIERAAIAAATPITYHSRELLLLIHEHLQASGFANTAATLLNEAHLSPLLSLATPFSLSDQSSREEIPSVQLQWPAGRTLCGFLLDKWKCTAWDEQNSTLSSSKKKPLAFSSSLSFRSRNELQAHDPNLPSTTKVTSSKQLPPVVNMPESSSVARSTANHPTECPYKTPIVLPMKRRLTDAKDGGSVPSQKRLNIGDHGLRSPIAPIVGFSKHARASQSYAGQITPSQLVVPNSTHSANTERLTLDSLVIHHLKNQHRQCPAPITTLPPLSLLHPHVCPEPKHSLDEPLNITARLSARSFRSRCGGVHRNRRDRQFIYSRFRPWRPCRDDGGVLMTCLSFLGDSSHIAVGTHNGELKIFDSTNNNLLESSASDPSFPLTRLQSHSSTERQLLLSSSSHVVRLWDASAVSGGPLQSFEGCKAARFSNSGNVFAALSLEASRREILLYDIQSSLLELKLSDTSVVSSAKVSGYCPIHFSPCDSLLLWNGVLWDRRASDPIHRFDQFTDYGGGGFHPAGNEVIINSEVWDLRKFRLLRSVPSLDQTVITFNGRGDVIYAILRRSEDITLAVNQRRSKHPLFSAFRTVDAVNYSEIATTPVDRCVLDFATEPKDYLVGLLTMDDPEDMSTSARLYEVGRRRPTDDDSDPDEAESDEEDEDGDEDAELLGDESGSDSEGEDDMGDEDEDSLVDVEDDDGDGNLMMDDVEFDVGHGVLEVLAEGNEDDSDEEDSEVEFGSDEDSDVQ